MIVVMPVVPSVFVTMHEPVFELESFTSIASEEEQEDTARADDKASQIIKSYLSRPSIRPAQVPAQQYPTEDILRYYMMGKYKEFRLCIKN
jgi:hypothetical protein